MFVLRLFLVAVLWYQNVLCDKKLCNFDDSNCTIQGIKRIYEELVNGDIKGTPASDPLHTDLIEADLPTLKYTLRNVSLTGIKSCGPELLKINPKDLTYTNHLACKHLVIQSLYEVKGKLGSTDIEGQGDVKIDFYDYVFLIDGVLEQKFDKDKKLHLQIKNYKLDMDARGKVVYDVKNLFNGDMDKSAAVHKYINGNWKEVDKSTSQPIMEKFMSLFAKNVNTYLDIVPIEHVFSEI